MYDLPALLQDPLLRAELRAALEGAPVQRIREAKLKLTARCNLRCTFCRIWQIHGYQELTTEEVLGVIDALASLDCRKIHLSGGEATLRPDLVAILQRAAEQRIRTALTTNGTTLTEALAHDLLASGVRSITCSLDGPSPELHDPLRGTKGAFKRTVAGLRHLQKARKALKAKAKIRLNMVLTRHNYQTYPDLLALAADLGIDEVMPLPVDEKSTTANRLLRWQVDEYNTTVAPAVASLRERLGFSTARHLCYPFGEQRDAAKQAADADYAQGYYTDHRCYAPWLYTLVDWQGDVWPCCMMRGRIAPLGNVRTASIREIFLGAAYSAVRQGFQAVRFPACARCDDFLTENRYLEAHLATDSAESPLPPSPRR